MSCSNLVIFYDFFMILCKEAWLQYPTIIGFCWLAKYPVTVLPRLRMQPVYKQDNQISFSDRIMNADDIMADQTGCDLHFLQTFANETLTNYCH